MTESTAVLCRTGWLAGWLALTSCVAHLLPLFSSYMRFFFAIIAYVLIGVILGVGLLLGMAKGSWWFLVVGLLAYVIGFAKIGCLPPKTHSH